MYVFSLPSNSYRLYKYLFSSTILNSHWYQPLCKFAKWKSEAASKVMTTTTEITIISSGPRLWKLMFNTRSIRINEKKTVFKGIIFHRQIGLSAVLGQRLAKKLYTRASTVARTPLVPCRHYWNYILNKQTKRPIELSSRKWKLFFQGNGNWWRPCNHERKRLIGPKHTFHRLLWHTSCRPLTKKLCAKTPICVLACGG